MNSGLHRGARNAKGVWPTESLVLKGDGVMKAYKHGTECFCQNESLVGHYRYLPKVACVAVVVRDNVVQLGFFQTVVWFTSHLYRRALTAVGLKYLAQSKTPDVADEVLNLQPGELVEVKSLDEILATLDSTGKHRGLGFSGEMREYCGRRMRVFKRVERICLESRPGVLRKLKNTVLLEGCICRGGDMGCDRSAFLFWRECWLKRVDPDGLERATT
ncbi:MAG: hypothetical protein JRN15_14420 [Nitrososphaerota archaeon]|nr:hypothetical protein [Nitrososphaerota archaeon]